MARCLESLGVEVIRDGGINTAYVFAHKKRTVVVYNHLIAPTVQQVALSHELAHIVLGHTRAGNCQPIVQKEAEATNIAWSMVAPRFVYFTDRLNSSDFYQPFAYQSFRNLGATHVEAEDAARDAKAAAESEFLELSRHCRHRFICQQGKVCPFAKYAYF